MYHMGANKKSRRASIIWFHSTMYIPHVINPSAKNPVFFFNLAKANFFVDKDYKPKRVELKLTLIDQHLPSIHG